MTWTKSEVQTLQAHIHNYYVEKRPLDPRDNPHVLPKLRSHIETHKMDIILSGIRNTMTTCSNRYNIDCQTIGNQVVRFTEYGQPDEIISRFIALAKLNDKGHKIAEVLLHKVLELGLPDDVSNYNPLP